MVIKIPSTISLSTKCVIIANKFISIISDMNLICFFFWLAFISLNFFMSVLPFRLPSPICRMFSRPRRRVGRSGPTLHHGINDWCCQESRQFHRRIQQAEETFWVLGAFSPPARPAGQALGDGALPPFRLSHRSSRRITRDGRCRTALPFAGG